MQTTPNLVTPEILEGEPAEQFAQRWWNANHDYLTTVFKMSDDEFAAHLGQE